MQKKSSAKSMIIFGVILVLGAGFYFYMSGSEAPVDDATLGVENTETSDATVAGARVLTILNQVNSLKIDKSLFTSPAYTTLIDHTVPIYDQSIGKTNPFYNPRTVQAKTR
jgi:hypothetical protein